MSYKSMPVYEHESDAEVKGLLDNESAPSRYDWPSKRSKKIETALRVFVTVAVVILAVLVGIDIMLLRTTLHRQESLSEQQSNTLRDTLPMTYGSDRRFMTLDTKYDHLWNEWTADAQLMVPGELPGEDRVQAAYTMFHQMHCLGSFRRAIQVARSGEDPGFDYWDNGHWPHCFDYLRQAILCWADDTIETAPVVDGQRQPGIDGSRTVRQCHSPQGMFERMRRDEKAVQKANEEDGLEHASTNQHGNGSISGVQ